MATITDQVPIWHYATVCIDGKVIVTAETEDFNHNSVRNRSHAARDWHRAVVDQNRSSRITAHRDRIVEVIPNDGQNTSRCVERGGVRIAGEQFLNAEKSASLR